MQFSSYGTLLFVRCDDWTLNWTNMTCPRFRCMYRNLYRMKDCLFWCIDLLFVIWKTCNARVRRSMICWRLAKFITCVNFREGWILMMVLVLKIVMKRHKRKRWKFWYIDYSLDQHLPATIVTAFLFFVLMLVNLNFYSEDDCCIKCRKNWFEKCKKGYF